MSRPEARRARSLSFLVAFWMAIAITAALVAHSVYSSLTGAGFGRAFWKDLTAVVILGGVLHAFLWVLFRTILLRPIEQIYLYLYRVGTGRREKLELATPVREMQMIADGLNLMVDRIEQKEVDHATPSDTQTALFEERQAQKLVRSFRRGLEPIGIWPAVVILSLGVLGLVSYARRGEPAAAAPQSQVDTLSTRVASLDRKLNTLTEGLQARDRRLDSLEATIAQLGRREEKPPAAPSTPATAAIPEELLARIASLEDLADDVPALATELAALRAELDGLGADPEPAEEPILPAQLVGNLQSQEDRIQQLENAIAELGRPTGLWGTIEGFLDATEDRFQSIQGNRLRRFRRESGSGYRSTISFPGASSVTVWSSRGTRWCEAVVSRDKTVGPNLEAFYRFQQRIQASLPPGWTSAQGVESGYQSLEIYRSGDGAEAFRVGVYSISEVGERAWVTAVIFGLD